MDETIRILALSGHPLIALETRDEVKAEAIVRAVATKLGVPLYEWSLVRGMKRVLPGPAETGVKPGSLKTALEYVLDHRGDRELYLFKDAGASAKDAICQRLLREIGSCPGITVILVDAEPLPAPVRRLCVPLSIPLPGPVELDAAVRETYKTIREKSLYDVTNTLAREDLDRIVQTLRGLTETEAARVVASAIHDDYQLTPDDLARIVEAKRNLLQSTGCLESIDVNFGIDEIGGLANLKRWLALRRGGTTPQARAFGLDPPRGVLMLGVQGCGKSLCARAVAADWKLPLLRMDPGVLYQKYIGETEQRLREALAQAEAMAPVILWIDEIEKAFASASATSSDGGLSQRMFGTLLSWMQDYRSPIFIVATANNISALPPELMRKGRFDEVFFVDLPRADSREMILAIHLKRRKRDPQQFDLKRVAEATEGFSGAELEQLVSASMYAAFSHGSELTTEHLLNEAKTTRPLSVLMAEKVNDLRAWAAERCVPAE